jgi:3-oxoacyl-[acyl-carrier protein] reductase
MADGLLAGETALVTGAASGIGRGIARALAGEGAAVVLADIAAEPGRALEQELVAKRQKAIFIPSDLSRAGEAERLFDQAVAALGRISILVHAASPRRHETQTVMAVSDDEWDQMLTVNLKGAFQLGRAAGAHMRERAIKGKILIVTSLHADTPRNLPHYSAAKAGMTMVMKELARALGPAGIRVNALAPGAIPGGGFAAAPRVMEAMVAAVPLGRLGTPEDCAAMAVALLSDRFAGYVTGTTIVVDGGLALHNWIPPRT